MDKTIVENAMLAHKTETKLRADLATSKEEKNGQIEKIERLIAKYRKTESELNEKRDEISSLKAKLRKSISLKKEQEDPHDVQRLKDIIAGTYEDMTENDPILKDQFEQISQMSPRRLKIHVAVRNCLNSL